MLNIFVLLIIFQFKHFLADYPLQGKYMLGKFADGWKWVLPLSAHAGVHFLFTLMICLFVRPQYWWLALFDFGTHFVMDRIKASPNLLGKYKALSANEMKEALKFLDDYKDFDPPPNLPTKNVVHDMIRRNAYFWWCLGVDQIVHHLSDLFIVYWLVA